MIGVPVLSRVWLRLVQLWRNEPAVLRSGIAGAIGLASLLLGYNLDADSIAAQLTEVIGFIVILGAGFAARPAVTPYVEDE